MRFTYSIVSQPVGSIFFQYHASGLIFHHWPLRPIVLSSMVFNLIIFSSNLRVNRWSYLEFYQEQKLWSHYVECGTMKVVIVLGLIISSKRKSNDNFHYLRIYSRNIGGYCLRGVSKKSGEKHTELLYWRWSNDWWFFK